MQRTPAYHLRQVQSREALIELCWSESSMESGRASLSVSLSSLRCQLEPHVRFRLNSLPCRTFGKLRNTRIETLWTMPGSSNERIAVRPGNHEDPSNMCSTKAGPKPQTTVRFQVRG